MRKVAAVFAMVLMVGACDQGSDPAISPDVAVVPGVVELTLRMGTEAEVPGSVVRLQLTRVPEDSRCPIDAVCIWEGNAVVEVGIRAGMGPTIPLQMNTNLEPRHADWNAIRVTVLELQPAPRAAEPTRQEDYVARVRIEPIG